MPNYCDNYLEVSGDIPELVEKFYQTARGKGLFWDENRVTRNTDEKKEEEPLDFSQFLYPKEVKGSFSEVGYHWCCDNWGTKWNAFDACCSWDNEYQSKNKFNISYSFTTAWSPMSEKLLKAMMKKFPSLRFEYQFNEPGVAFYGSSDQDGNIYIYDYLKDSEIQNVIDKLFDIGYYSFDNMEQIEESEEDNKYLYRQECYEEVNEMYETLICDSGSDHEIDAEELYNNIISMWEFEKQTTLKS
tara:strand:+ start:1146 stop:1877 length:732 start_codon:yes stop_codon:yes gene_type:complete